VTDQLNLWLKMSVISSDTDSFIILKELASLLFLANSSTIRSLVMEDHRGVSGGDECGLAYLGGLRLPIQLLPTGLLRTKCVFLHEHTTSLH
jgi:hypothetical protein